MYYNSNRNSNDYYNSYKRELAELEAYKKEETIQKIIKLLLTILALGLIITGSYYLYKYFNPIQETQNSEQLPKIVIGKEELPHSIQLRESKLQTAQYISQNATDTKKVTKEKQNVASNMNEKDIALIVQIIMSQMNTKANMPLEKELQAVDNKKFKNTSLKESNHYNKVVLGKQKAQGNENSLLMELRSNLNNIVEEEQDTSSNYAQAIKKEVVYRQNEMRIIIVQKGDTLSRIAKKAYGSYDDYQKIFTANPEIIKNPNQIFVGQRLRIPLERS